MGHKRYYDKEKCNLILLAGSGFSVDVGYKSFQEQVEALTDMRHISIIKEVYNQLDNNENPTVMLEALINKLEYYYNIDKVLRDVNGFQIDRFLWDNYALKHTMPNFRGAVKKCYEALLESYGPKPLADTYSDIFDFKTDILVKMADVNDITSPKTGAKILDVYTTNYDCLFQLMGNLKSSELAVFSHIDNKPVEGEDGKFDNDSWYKQSEFFVPADPAQKNARSPEIYIHRLHGCIGWYNEYNKKEDSDDKVTINTREKFGAGGTEEYTYYPRTGDAEADKSYFLDHLCIKLIESQYMGVSKIAATAFNEFFQQLLRAKALLVWGYSFQDLEVLRVINQAIFARSRTASPLKIFYVDTNVKRKMPIDNAKKTIENTPIYLSRDFSPKRLDSRFRDNYTSHDSALTDMMKKITSTIVQPYLRRCNDGR